MHPRDDLIRARFDDLEPVGDGNTLYGYAAVFNTPARINSWEGKFTEVLAPGAFKRTLAQRGDKVVSQFNHGMGEYSLPIGAPQVLREDNHGLYVEIELDQDPWVQQTLKPKLGRSITGWSFRFSVTDDEWSADGETRTVRSLKMSEVGPVTFPAYEATKASVRSREGFLMWAAQHNGVTDISEAVLRAFDPALDGTSEPPEDSPTLCHLSPETRDRLLFERVHHEIQQGVRRWTA